MAGLLSCWRISMFWSSGFKVKEQAMNPGNRDTFSESFLLNKLPLCRYQELFCFLLCCDTRKPVKYYLWTHDKPWSEEDMCPAALFWKASFEVNRLDKILEYRGHAGFRPIVSLLGSQVMYWKRPFAENCFYNTVFCFLSLSKEFTDRTEVLGCFIEIEKHTVHMFTLFSFSSKWENKGAKCIAW